jgi:2,4-dienoyl-CoA reductase-like NADH-dependent reductase (Old Yellow Enzyme family)
VALARSADLAAKAGIDVINIHRVHGYLIHEFLSPVINCQPDKYSGSFENRTRIVQEIVEAVRSVTLAWTALFLRISTTK